MILIAEFAYISSQISLRTKSRSFYADSANKSLKLLPQFFSKSFPLNKCLYYPGRRDSFLFSVMTALINKDP